MTTAPKRVENVCHVSLRTDSQLELNRRDPVERKPQKDPTSRG